MMMDVTKLLGSQTGISEMLWAVLIVAGYVVASFLVSAMLVRFAPDLRTSFMVRKNFANFLVVPLLLLVEPLFVKKGNRQNSRGVTATLFEKLSGRRLYSRQRYSDYDSYLSREKANSGAKSQGKEES